MLNLPDEEAQILIRLRRSNKAIAEELGLKLRTVQRPTKHLSTRKYVGASQRSRDVPPSMHYPHDLHNVSSHAVKDYIVPFGDAPPALFKLVLPFACFRELP